MPCYNWSIFDVMLIELTGVRKDSHDCIGSPSTSHSHRHFVRLSAIQFIISWTRHSIQFGDWDVWISRIWKDAIRVNEFEKDWFVAFNFVCYSNYNTLERKHCILVIPWTVSWSDGEGSVIPSRVFQLATETTHPTPDALLKGIHYQRVCSKDEFIASIYTLEEKMNRLPLQLIVIDSMACFLRYSTLDHATRSKILHQLGHLLVRLAIQHQCAVGSKLAHD
jgi:hypothetical protein